MSASNSSAARNDATTNFGDFTFGAVNANPTASSSPIVYMVGAIVLIAVILLLWRK